MTVIFLNIWLVLLAFAVFIDFSEEQALFDEDVAKGKVEEGKSKQNFSAAAVKM